jgi:predicted PurR-regulated permease PerM
MSSHNSPPASVPPSVSARRYAVPFMVLIALVLVLTLLFFFVVRVLALPLVLAAVVALLLHPAQVELERRLGRDWLAAAILTVLFVAAIVAPLAATVYTAQGELHQLFVELEPTPGGEATPAADNPRLQPSIRWISQTTGFEEERVRGWVRTGGAELQQAVYHRSMALLGDLPGMFVGLAVFLLSLFFFLKDGPALVESWVELTPLEYRHERVVHREFVRVTRGVIYAALTTSTVQGILFAVGMFVIDLFTNTGIRPWILALALTTMVSSTIPFLGAAAVWAVTSAVLFVNGHHAAAVALAVYGAAVISQIDALIQMIVLKGTARMHPLLVFVSILGGIQVLGILGIVVGPVTAAILVALLRVMKHEVAHPREVAKPAAADSADGDPAPTEANTKVAV